MDLLLASPPPFNFDFVIRCSQLGVGRGASSSPSYTRTRTLELLDLNSRMPPIRTLQQAQTSVFPASTKTYHPPPSTSSSVYYSSWAIDAPIDDGSSTSPSGSGASSSSNSITRAPRPSRPASSSRRKKPAGHVPRPPNAFLLYRSHFIRSTQLTDKTKHANLSKLAGDRWANLSPSDKAYWHGEADRVKEEHMEKHPEYRYTPVPKLKPKSPSATGSSTPRDGGATSSLVPDALDLIYDGVEYGLNVDDPGVERVAPLIQPANSNSSPLQTHPSPIATVGIPITTAVSKRDPFRLSTYANIHGTTLTTTTVDISSLPSRDYPSHEQYPALAPVMPVGNVDPRFPFQTRIQVDDRPRPSVDNDERIFLDPLVQPDAVTRVMERTENGGQTRMQEYIPDISPRQNHAYLTLPFDFSSPASDFPLPHYPTTIPTTIYGNRESVQSWPSSSPNPGTGTSTVMGDDWGVDKSVWTASEWEDRNVPARSTRQYAVTPSLANASPSSTTSNSTHASSFSPQFSRGPGFAVPPSQLLNEMERETVVIGDAYDGYETSAVPHYPQWTRTQEQRPPQVHSSPLSAWNGVPLPTPTCFSETTSTDWEPDISKGEGYAFQVGGYAANVHGAWSGGV